MLTGNQREWANTPSYIHTAATPCYGKQPHWFFLKKSEKKARNNIKGKKRGEGNSYGPFSDGSLAFLYCVFFSSSFFSSDFCPLTRPEVVEISAPFVFPSAIVRWVFSLLGMNGGKSLCTPLHIMLIQAHKQHSINHSSYHSNHLPTHKQPPTNTLRR